ncbi:hypothetical protein M8C21_015835 [Ambrosia artemisiifolia]|uniref:Uncharacterized protein n=1 Tax=Ambrosia artemisiifolia TaxID=4212 RepID=A0AAD5CB17_AMBAR|nr:hypothetical protein M8C21_015835 [Ambrosia artemisiifolia]
MIRRFKVSHTLFDTILHTEVTIFSNQSTLAYIPTTSNHPKNRKEDDPIVFTNKYSYPDVYSCTKMIQSYVRNNRINDALKVFDEMPVRDTVMWNSMIKGCLDCGSLEVAFKLFDEMPERNVVSWTTMVSGLLLLGRTEVAERLFREMPVKDEAAWNAMIYGCFVNGKVEEAVGLFHKMPSRSVISWTSMISGLDQTGKSDEALVIFKQMLFCGVRPASMTFSSVLTACANVKNMHFGFMVHGHVVKLGYLSDAYITAPLITFYAHCKDVDSCCKVFNEKAHSSVVVWTSLLTGYGLNCKHENALEVFSDMLRSNVLPNQSSFTSALNSCCELEALDRGKEINGAAIKLGLETDVFVVKVNLEHYACMVDILGRNGRLNEAVELAKNMPMEPNTSIWLALLSACKMHSNLKLAETAAEAIFNLDPNCSAAYTLLSNLYAFAGRWHDVSRIRGLMKNKGIMKERGVSWVNLKGIRHEFVSGDKSHPMTSEIYAKLEWIGEKLKGFGYVPDQMLSIFRAGYRLFKNKVSAIAKSELRAHIIFVCKLQESEQFLGKMTERICNLNRHIDQLCLYKGGSRQGLSE